MCPYAAHAGGTVFLGEAHAEDAEDAEWGEAHAEDAEWGEAHAEGEWGARTRRTRNGGKRWGRARHVHHGGRMAIITRYVY